MKVAIYARVSLGEKKGQSLDWQLETIQDKVNKEGWELTKTFTDQETGSSMLRPEFRRMLLCAKNKDFDAIVVFKLDRLSRFSPVDGLYLMGKLKKMNIEIVSVLEPWFALEKLDEPLTMLHIFIVFWQSWSERITIQQRAVASSKKHNPGGRPKGKNDATPRRRRWKSKPNVSIENLFE